MKPIIVVFLLFVSFMVVGSFGGIYFYYLSSQSILVDQSENYIETISHSRASHVITYLKEQEEKIKILAFEPEYAELLKSPGDVELREKVQNKLDRFVNEDIFLEVDLWDDEGKVIASTTEELVGFDYSNLSFYKKGKNNTLIDLFYNPTYGIEKNTLGIVNPIFDEKTGELLGLFAASMSLEDFNKITIDRNGLGVSGETYIINQNSILVSPLRSHSGGVLEEKIDTLQSNLCVAHAVNESSGKIYGNIERYLNYNKVMVLGSYVYMPEMKWCFIYEISEMETFNFLRSELLKLALVILVALSAIMIFFIFLSQKIIFWGSGVKAKINKDRQVNWLRDIRNGWRGIGLAVIVGILAILLKNISDSSLMDPLFVALVIGIVLGSFVKFDNSFIPGFNIMPLLLLPIGVVFYGAVNLKFKEFVLVDPTFIFIISAVLISYLIAVFLFSTLFGLKDKVSYLVAIGSAVCGASAIAVSSRAVDAEPDDISKSLIPVFIAALFGLFILLPLLGKFLALTGVEYSIMAGSLLQFTGFVKMAIGNLPATFGDLGGLMSLALSVKAVRYVALLVLVPMFGSFIRGKFYVPWYLWAFLIAGLTFSFVPALEIFDNSFKLILDILWSIAMAAIGLNANIKGLFSKDGAKALAVAVLAFLVAVGVFLGMLFGLRGITL